MCEWQNVIELIDPDEVDPNVTCIVGDCRNMATHSVLTGRTFIFGQWVDVHELRCRGHLPSTN